jgi:hypothetical protein
MAYLPPPHSLYIHHFQAEILGLTIALHHPFTRIPQVIIFLHLAFYLSDGLPLSLTILGILSHFVYLSNFSRAWPSISFTSLSFISSCCMVIIDHFAWFFYFADRVSHHHHRPSPQSWFFSTRNRLPDQLTFIDITTFVSLFLPFGPY